jgi:hypothetical protein
VRHTIALLRRTAHVFAPAANNADILRVLAPVMHVTSISADLDQEQIDADAAGGVVRAPPFDQARRHTSPPFRMFIKLSVASWKVRL